MISTTRTLQLGRACHRALPESLDTHRERPRPRHRGNLHQGRHRRQKVKVSYNVMREGELYVIKAIIASF